MSAEDYSFEFTFISNKVLLQEFNCFSFISNLFLSNMFFFFNREWVFSRLSNILRALVAPFMNEMLDWVQGTKVFELPETDALIKKQISAET